MESTHVIDSPSAVDRKITFTVSAAEIDKVLDAAARSFGQDVSLPGFRKGKVPAKVVEKRFGDEIAARATDQLVNGKISALLQENNIKPVGRVRLEGAEQKPVVRGTEYTFACVFEVLPEIALPEDLSALSVDVEKAEVSAEELEKLTHSLLQRLATLEDITETRKPADNDVVLVDVEGTVDGKAVPGMSANNFLMQLRPESSTEVDNIVRSLDPGAEGTGSMICPEDYPDPTYRGKTIDLSVRLHKISREVLPEIDDELAKKVGFEKEEQLRKAIMDQAMGSKMSEIRSKAQQSLLDSVLETLEFELPKSIVSLYLNSYLMETRDFLTEQGLDNDAITETLKNMKDEAQDHAVRQAKTQTFLMVLAEKEQLTVSEQEIDREIRQMAAQTKQEYAQLRDHLIENGLISDLQDRILANKAMDLMYTKAAKNEVAPAETPAE